MATASTRTGVTSSAKIRSLLLTGVAATAIAAAATVLVATAGTTAGVTREIGGVPIPLSGFAVVTAICSLVGLALAAVLSRFARHPRTVWVRTTLVLIVLSFVPDVIADAAVSTKALLMLTHVVAAAIVIPAVARRLSK